MEYLFVGGAQDGKHIKLRYPPPERVEYPVPQPFLHPPDAVQTVVVKVEVYSLRCLSSGDGPEQIHWLYVLSTITAAEMLRRLLSGYRGSL